MTPVQVVRNLVGLTREADRERPSVLLTTLVQARLAAERLGPRSEPAHTRADVAHAHQAA
jgi:hypothetical protein